MSLKGVACFRFLRIMLRDLLFAPMSEMRTMTCSSRQPIESCCLLHGCQILAFNKVSGVK